jgi:hypothetical protein
MAQLYPQAPDSLFITFCCSQGCDGWNLTSLHTEYKCYTQYSFSASPAVLKNIKQKYEYNV